MYGTLGHTPNKSCRVTVNPTKSCRVTVNPTKSCRVIKIPEKSKMVSKKYFSKMTSSKNPRWRLRKWKNIFLVNSAKKFLKKFSLRNFPQVHFVRCNMKYFPVIKKLRKYFSKCIFLQNKK